jgi:hypothetical protein
MLTILLYVGYIPKLRGALPFVSPLQLHQEEGREHGDRVILRS